MKSLGLAGLRLPIRPKRGLKTSSDMTHRLHETAVPLQEMCLADSITRCWYLDRFLSMTCVVGDSTSQPHIHKCQHHYPSNISGIDRSKNTLSTLRSSCHTLPNQSVY